MMKVVVIGGVAAGMSAAAKLKRNMGNDVDIVVFEKGRAVSYGACGIPFYIGGVIEEPDRLVERTAEQFAESGIDVRLEHEAIGVDTSARTVRVRGLETGKTFDQAYDKLIVASGARVRHIAPFDVERENLHVVRDVEDGVRLNGALDNDGVRDVLIVGAGFIGLEIAEACERRGKQVTVVEFAERILSVMDPEMTDLMTEELERHGIAVRTDSKAVELVCEGNRIRSVVVESAGERERLEADLVINCAGIVPNTEFIEVDKTVNGAIIVDGQMRTSAKDVYAAGDCSIMTSFITREHQYAPLGSNANKQGRIVAEAIAGKAVPAFKLLGSSAIRLFGVDAAKVGLSEIDAQRLSLDYKVNRITGNSYASYYHHGKVMIKLIYDAKTRKLLGAQTLGQGAVVQRANYYAVAITSGMTVDDFGFIDLCYSPPFGGVWDASLIAANTAK